MRNKGRVIKDGDITEDDDLKARAGSLDREMLLVMRQAIAAALVREAGLKQMCPRANYPECQ